MKAGIYVDMQELYINISVYLFEGLLVTTLHI